MAKKAQEAQVEVNIDELKDYLTHIVTNNRFIQAKGMVPVAVEVVGESGIGKTSTMMQLSNELNLNVVKLNLAQIEELGDLVGYPVRQFQLCKEIPAKMEKKQITEGRVMKLVDVPVAGTGSSDCLWIDEQAVQEYTKQGYSFTGQKRMSYCPPEWIADKQGGGLLILDDYNRGDMRFLQACMELIDRQQYISWSLPKDWHIVLTCNPDNGDYLVNELDVAQKTRFITANLKFDIDCWARWAEKTGVDGRCINFLLMHPELVTQSTNARSITTFFNSISSFESFEKNLPMIQMIGEGSVGVEFSTLFTLFINNKLDKLISPLKMLTGKVWSEVKKDLVDCIGKDASYRADIASILSTRLINYTSYYSEKNAITQAIIDRIIAISTEDVMANDLKYYIVKGILNSQNRAKFQPMMLNTEVVRMSTK
jgi:hypothetical protein